MLNLDGLSTPPRQPLFKSEDFLDGGTHGAERTTANNATQDTLRPTTSHAIIPPTAACLTSAKAAADAERLCDDDNAVFLLMDSRES
ncbi:uncharacterized protein LACBIDRAFT_316909 [Laccaria bicolor S238N-H82]|uniref:Predicted protein n=1 Tax=Laccaria bicolor (strain S238N-H82 / ATCC MYA-4686) TaxID=486041 RepID=B0D592_LACBS|nr:uncharacterized protein LACBIDRAFT_316909 [Laccaria bicolor S238N-H82]EDR10475.1 predicted protein [Laccaria bicolor S238N-H82]|eukprot:XP_001878925.1 predicted protein [Laccaria bicolor S238N-H82]